MTGIGQCDIPTYWLISASPEAFPPPDSLPSTMEVVIVGGGIMGVSTAYWLARFGIEVLLLENQGLCWGATGRNAGLMLAGAAPLEHPGLVKEVLDEEQIQADYDKPGHLALASSPQIWGKICDEVERRHASGSPLYALDLPSCEDLLRMRIAGNFLGGRWFPDGGVVHPSRFVYGLAAAAGRYGAFLATWTRALEVGQVPGREQILVRTTRGNVKARHIVYACNARMGDFLPDFRKVITPVLGQVLSTEPLPAVFTVGLAVDWGTVYWRQVSDGTILLGGQPIRDLNAEISYQEVINPRIQGALDSFLPETFPDFPPFKVSRRWAGVMDFSKDGKPIIGPLPGRMNQWVLAGFGGHGMPAGLGAGKAVADAIAKEELPVALKQFDPARFKQLVANTNS